MKTGSDPQSLGVHWQVAVGSGPI